MGKRILTLLAVALLLGALMLSGGCNGKVNMVTGSWQVLSTGDETGQNQQANSLPFTMYYDVYPDGHVKLLFAGEEMAYGTYKMDRDTFSFVSDKGDEKYSGQFVINNNAQDQNDGTTYMQMMIYLDNAKKSVVLKKVMDYSGLLKYLKAKASASPAAASAAPAPVASPAPTVAPTAS